MAQQTALYTLLKKAKVSVVDGSVTIVYTLVRNIDNVVLIDNLPTNLAATVQANLAAVAGQYDYIGS